MTSATESQSAPPVSSAASDTDEIDDASDAEEAPDAELRAIRNSLKARVRTSTHPSRLINQICLADMRCSESAQTLTHLLGRSPKILKVIRAELYKAFKEEPDDLLFTVPAKDGEPEKVDSLTSRALSLLFEPWAAASVCASTTLTIKGKPGSRLTLTPLEALQRVVAMRLYERLIHAAANYWDTLAYGSWRTRRERWVALHEELFAAHALIARQLDELSSTGMAMVQAVIDAPGAPARQAAGGDWACVRVGQLLWPGTPAMVIPGALHIYREGDPSGVPHIIYLPGVARNLYEYPSFVALQCGVLELSKSRFDELWQCLPLNRRHMLCRPADLSPASSVVRGQEILEDALALGAQELLSQQWNNELACVSVIYHQHVFAKERPQPLDAGSFLKYVEGNRKQLVGWARLGELRDELLDWDHQRRSTEIIFASVAPGLALRTAEQQIKRYEKGMVALLDPDDPSAETPAHQEVVAWVGQLKVHAQTLNALSQGAGQRLLHVDFWSERPGGEGTPRRVVSFMHAQTEALRCEVQLQHRLKLLSTAHRDLMIEVVEQPLPARRPDSQTQVLSIAIGSELDDFYSLHNIWVVTTAAAVRVPLRQLPVVLYAFGEEGGVMAFAGLDALTRSVKASLVSRDDSVLWGCVARDKRNNLRTHAVRETLEVRYVPIPGKPALASLKKRLGSCDRLYKSTDHITRIFSEVKDADMSRALLLTELEQHLQVPFNSALSRAQANIELLRNVALEAKKLPAWLAGATRAQRKHFRRSKKLYMSSTWAFLSRLEQRLPDLNTYARQALTARLRDEGISLGVQIDEPFMAMSGDIHGTYCDYKEACLLKDPQKILPPSSSCRAFSLLELALHNLDPLAPWTHYKLNRACPLRWTWPDSLSTGRLRQIVSSLDVGGRYDALINKVFYPSVNPSNSLSKGRIPELLNRALRAGVEHHLFSAIQHGLSANAQSVFSTAMAARTPQDLMTNPHELHLHVVHLVGHTMQHDRYVAGIVVVQDKRSQLCVVYWPQAPLALVLTEYSNLEKAGAELNRLCALPDNLKTLARQVAPGWAFQAKHQSPFEPTAFNILDVLPGSFLVRGIWRLTRLLRVKHLEPSLLLDEIEEQALEQIASDPRDWLAIVATSNCNAQALLYHGKVHELQRQAQAASYSNKALKEYRIRRLRDGSLAKTRMVLSLFIPVLGVFSDIYELYVAARRYKRYGDPSDKRVLADTIKLLMVNLVMTFVPGPKVAGVAGASAIRSALPPALGRIRRWRVEPSGGPRSASSVRQLPALERFKTASVPEGAVALKGPGREGVYVKNGGLFVADDTHHYPVYKRGSEQGFRLKNQQSPGQDELILDIHQSREWLLGADAPQPVAGTSSSMPGPWTAPVPPSPDWSPPLVRTATEDWIKKTVTAPSDGLQWRMQTPNVDQMILLAPDVYHIPMDSRGFACNVLRDAPAGASLADPSSAYYRLLPQGNQAPLDGIVFIMKDEPLVSLASVDLERWTSTARLEQPIAASRTSTNDWVFHTPLFNKPLAESVGDAFPAMTIKSRDFTVARMIERADSSRSATATHLLNVRATLDGWLPALPASPGQTDDLLRMLRYSHRKNGTVFIGFDGKAPGFTRVDFQATGLDPSLRPSRGGRWVERNDAQYAAVRQVLERQGFSVNELRKKRGRRFTRDFIATHTSSDQNLLYYVTVQWAEKGVVTLHERLTDGWFNRAISRSPKLSALVQVKSAMEEGRLIRIAAGIQWPVRGTVPPSVYFVKVSPF
ncbi:dermonecrotic toxin domain-containing protein [Pseudomonas sp. EA_65y_Pfl1_P120]|uniref:dermonecrotic toxin domain-containing protein n=1 Tax=Pseudomonas sp. EA_65y_Pfl1_P120 TaxID=3088693 RepID=UPI0030D91E65